MQLIMQLKWEISAVLIDIGIAYMVKNGYLENSGIKTFSFIKSSVKSLSTSLAVFPFE